ncbi:MAG: FHA domain-containing protein [Ignavibacteria bacterium]|nr:FHA domain-containing protein [Ignavibacteria bacterium]MCU7504637.1 FHA domain-containing protein [Ignavibacteria bacterium]MCU7517555.1 FHA domain-containing protein [Ignavibacteria bacterium]
MRKYIVPASALLVIFWSVMLFAQAGKVIIEEISQKPDVFNSRAVEVEGVVTQYVASTSATTSYYIINGEYGGSVKVNTSLAAPQLFKRYKVTGTVYIDPVNKAPFISERTRSSLEPAEPSVQSQGTDPLVMLLAVLFLLLAAIFIYTQMRRRKERDYEEVIYAFPLQGTESGEMSLPETPREVPFDLPREKPGMEPPAGEKDAERSEVLDKKERVKKDSPVRDSAMRDPALKGSAMRGSALKGSAMRDPGASYESDFRTIKIVPPAPQTITFIPGLLEIISGDDKGKSFRIAGFPTQEGSVVSIGREVVTGERAYAHIQLNEKFRTVSRRQAELIYRDHKLFVKNLSETNLTQVDGVELKPGECAELKPDAKMRTGELEFQYKIN